MNKDSRFTFIRYDEYSQTQQADVQAAVVALEDAINRLHDGRAKSLALTKLEECYMWAGKQIRDTQIAREATLSEGRS